MSQPTFPAESPSAAGQIERCLEQYAIHGDGSSLNLLPQLGLAAGRNDRWPHDISRWPYESEKNDNPAGFKRCVMAEREISLHHLGLHRFGPPASGVQLFSILAQPHFVESAPRISHRISHRISQLVLSSLAKEASAYKIPSTVLDRFTGVVKN